MYGADPRLAELGTKSGCRKLFEEVGIPPSVGAEDLHSVEDVADVIMRMRKQRPTMSQAIAQTLDERPSGPGNGLVDLRGLPAPGEADERREVLNAWPRSSSSRPTPRDVYLAKLTAGGIVEERIVGAEVRSPERPATYHAPRRRRTSRQRTISRLAGQRGQSYHGLHVPRRSGIRPDDQPARQPPRPSVSSR